MILDFQTDAAVAPSIALVREAGLTGDVVVSGCGVECFDLMAAATDEITTLLNLDDLPAGFAPAAAGAIARRSIDVGGALGAAGINPEHSLVDAALVARAREVGLGVWTWVVDDEDRVAELIDMGVTAITTNRPERMLALVRSRSLAATEETDG